MSLELHLPGPKNSPLPRVQTLPLQGGVTAWKTESQSTLKEYLRQKQELKLMTNFPSSDIIAHFFLLYEFRLLV